MSPQNCKEGKSYSESALGEEKSGFWGVFGFFSLFPSPPPDAVALSQRALRGPPDGLRGAGERRVLCRVSASHGGRAREPRWGSGWGVPFQQRRLPKVNTAGERGADGSVDAGEKQKTLRFPTAKDDTTSQLLYGGHRPALTA